MRRSDYRTELKTLTIEQLEVRVDYLLDKVLSVGLSFSPHKPTTSYLRKHVYAKALLEKLKSKRSRE
ncbi:MAG: hypothetical protein AABY22_33190 [Nanoarchaeota archaeon]